MPATSLNRRISRASLLGATMLAAMTTGAFAGDKPATP